MKSLIGRGLRSRATDLVSALDLNVSIWDSFLSVVNTGLGDIPRPIFLECLSRALQRGSSEPVIPFGSSSWVPRRPALPYEVVTLIFRYARFHRPRSVPLIPDMYARRTVTSSGPLKSRVVACTPPLTEHDLRTLCALRVVTISKHQGHVGLPSQGSWSWFELALAKSPPSSRPTTKRPVVNNFAMGLDGSLSDSSDSGLGSDDDTALAPDALSFRSHTHPIVSRSFQRHDSGNSFSIGSEAAEMILEKAEVGDVLMVVACAQFPGWACVVQEVKVQGWV